MNRSKSLINPLASLVTASMLWLSGAASAADDWEFSLAPLFLWGQSLDGSSTINGKTAPLDLDFKDDVWENLDAAFTFHFEARRGDWTIFTEYQFVDLRPSVDLQLGPIAVEADVSFKEDIFELGSAWAFSDNETTRWEVLGGARYTDQKLTLKTDASLPLPGPGRQNKRKGGDDWWHGFLGARVMHELSENWTFIARADYGYGGSDNSALNGTFMFDYSFRDWGSVFIGGRYMEYDYASSSYGMDASRSGPLMGLMLHW